MARAKDRGADRLKRALRERDEALAFQAATDQILAAISRSPSDAKPVFDAIVRSVPRLFGTRYVAVFLVKGEELHLAASRADADFERRHGPVFRRFRESFPQPIDWKGFTGRALRSGKVSQIAPIIGNPKATPQAVQLAEEFGYNAMLVAPLVRDGKTIGAIGTTRPEAKLFDARELALFNRFAAQAVIAIENARRFNETKEALEQQTATSQILGVISSSPTDLAPVFDAILASAMQLCEAHLGTFNLYDGEWLHSVAQRGGNPQFAKWLLERGAIKPDGGMTYQAITEHRAVQIADVREAPGYREGKPNISKFVDLGAVRTFLAVPLLKEGAVIGTIGIYRPDVRPFTDKQIALVSTFANQAVIAIENARLFNETKEALERQTATAEILKVISGSPTATQPVFESIVQKCHALYQDSRVALLLIDDGRLITRASTGYVFEPMPIDRESGLGACVLEARTIHLPDLEAAAEQYPRLRQLGIKHGYRSGIYAPLMREGRAVGGISVLRRAAGAFSEKDVALLTTFADQAVIAIENARLFNETKESLEQQTASADILRVISSTPSNTQPVFEAIVQAGLRVFAGAGVGVVMADAERVRVVAAAGVLGPMATSVDMPRSRESATGTAVVDGVVVNIRDTEAPDAPLYARANGRALGFRAIAAAPMLREGKAIGAIGVVLREPGGLSDKQIALLKTFAAQAVIAIENARLFKETNESLEQQTATADILGAMSSSMTNTKPVFDAIVKSCHSLFSGSAVALHLVRNGMMHVEANIGFDVPPMPVDRGSAVGTCVLDGRSLHFPDLEEAAKHYPRVRQLGLKFGYQSGIYAPLMRGGEAIGTILVLRLKTGAFSEKEIALLNTFADQAVIAIENVRLFNETKESLERQTATAEILKVIAASPNDIQPVLDAVGQNAARLCEANNAVIFRLEDGLLRQVAAYGGIPTSSHPTAGLPLDRSTVTGRAVVDRQAIHIHDLAAGEREFPEGSKYAKRDGHRTTLATPLLREGVAIGAILIRRMEVRPFSDRQIALLQTFADQAVIAIENVRLFNETKEALEQQTASAEILKVISASPTDVQPVFDAVAANAARVCGVDDVAILKVEEGGLRRVAHVGSVPVLTDPRVPLLPGGVNELVLSERRTVHVPDTLAADFVSRFPGSQHVAMGVRALLATPLVRDNAAIGLISMRRTEPRAFTDKQIALLETFADQAVIAIENVRLFKELQERTESLTRSVGQLTALGEVGQAISSTLEVDEVLRTIVQRAVQLAGLDGGAIWEFDERDERFHLRAAENIVEEILDVYRSSPIRLGEGAVGRAGATREPVVVEDVLDESYQSRVRAVLIKSGARALLAVPLLREDLLLGALVVNRKSPGPFAPEAIGLLKTFATQSAVAIQNARLFRELAEKSAQLEEASRHKSQFLASMSHELRTPLNAILGFNEMILGQVYGEVPRDMQEPLEDIQKSGKHLLRLINNVLDLAKIEAGKMELALADYSVQDTVESVRSTLRPLAEAKGLELVASVPQDIPLAYGDSGRLTQCLMNLAGNSLKFTKEGRVEIAVEVNNGRLTWRVSDTGIGIPPEKIETLFSEFRQTDATIASEYGGTGLGLSITKKFVEMHGGRIWVESEPGKGSAFTVEIPLRVTAPA